MKATNRTSKAGLLHVFAAYCLLPTAYWPLATAHWPLATAYCLLPTAYSCFAAHGEEARSDRIVIDSNFPGAYQVEVADVNGDKKPDIVVVGGSTCAWFENPTWKKRIVSGSNDTPGIISSATADLDGDGKAEIAIAYEFAMNTPKKGKLLIARQGSRSDDAWKFDPLRDVPSIHRLRWGDVDGKEGLELIISPIFGRDAKPPAFQESRAGILRYRANSMASREAPSFQVLSTRVVLHAIDVIDVTGDGRADILTADNEGVQLIAHRAGAGSGEDTAWQKVALVAGAPGTPPKRGCSEVHFGRANGSRFLATLEPWHGSQVVVWPESAPGSLKFGPRLVIDDTLADGHALWAADIDGDGDHEIFAGHRGKDHRVSMYHFDRTDQCWKKTVIDREIAAQDLRGGDIDGDGTPDVVGVGGSTHNVVWYRFSGKPGK